MVDLPEPESPVNQIVAPAARCTWVACQVTLGLLLTPALAAEDHAGAHRGVCRLVDEDERTGRPVAAVLVGEQRLGGAQGDPADLVEPQMGRVLVAVQG